MEATNCTADCRALKQPVTYRGAAALEPGRFPSAHFVAGRRWHYVPPQLAFHLHEIEDGTSQSSGREGQGDTLA